jgi:hypothetical protein
MPQQSTFCYDDAQWGAIANVISRSRRNNVTPRLWHPDVSEEKQIRFWLQVDANGYLDRAGSDPNKHIRDERKHLQRVAAAATKLLEAIEDAEPFCINHFLGDHFPTSDPWQTDRMLDDRNHHQKVIGAVLQAESVARVRASAITEVFKPSRENASDYWLNDFLLRVRDVWVSDFGGRPSGRPTVRFMLAVTEPVLAKTKNRLAPGAMAKRLERFASREDRQTSR